MCRDLDDVEEVGILRVVVPILNKTPIIVGVFITNIYLMIRIGIVSEEAPTIIMMILFWIAAIPWAGLMLSGFIYQYMTFSNGIFADRPAFIWQRLKMNKKQILPVVFVMGVIVVFCEAIVYYSS
ncbi:MAG: hypothetical protein KAR42_09215 [candidate division Zixibacteria bacterium]|nr:hypothetical protein [candidate division Zixibacteria bacterium]